MTAVLKEETGVLCDCLGLGKKSLVAIVGAGGKTTLMRRLTEELTGIGKKVAATTTTKVREAEAGVYPGVVLTDEEIDPARAIGKCLEHYGSVFVGKNLLDNGKISGIDSEEADRLFLRGDIDHVLVEADGAAGRPLKAPAGHEPVVPSLTTMTVAVAGCEVLGRPLSHDLVFRQERFQEITETAPGEIISPEKVSALFLHAGGIFKGTPKEARLIAFLNKMELVVDINSMESLAELLLAAASGVDLVIAGSLNRKKYRLFRRN